MAARVDRVPVGPLRAAFEASGMTLTEVCRRLGWDRPGRGTASTSNLSRALGIQGSTTISKGKRYTSFASTVSRDKAARICAALDLDFDEMYPGPLPEARPRGGRCVCGERLARPVAHGLCGFCLERLESGMAA